MSQKSYFQNVDTLDEYDTAPTNEQPAMGTLSKQFQPKKFKDGSKIWNKDAEQQDETQSYSYTPFKASTLSKSQTTPKPTRDVVHTGTLRPPKANPFVYDPPSAPGTPRTMRARPESAAGNTMSREQKLTWGRAPPPSTHFRSASAMSQPRSMPRQNEFAPLAVHQPPPPPLPIALAQRYPSYSTLPRDPIDMSQMHVPPFYPPPPQMLSRPPSAVPSLVHPGPHHMASNLPSFVAPLVDQKPSPRAVTNQLAISSSYINWNRISLVCCMQVLFCLSIFGVGVTRILFGSLWAIGLEIVFATCCLFPALIGIYAVKRGSYPAVIFCFVANAFEIIFGLIPFLIGLFPVFPIIFPKVDQHWFLSLDEPIHLDLILSFLVALQCLFSFHLAVTGCKTCGALMTSVDEIKLQNHMKEAFEEATLPYKHTV